MGYNFQILSFIISHTIRTSVSKFKNELAGKMKSHFKNALHAMLHLTVKVVKSRTVSLQTYINTPVILTLKATF